MYRIALRHYVQTEQDYKAWNLFYKNEQSYAEVQTDGDTKCTFVSDILIDQT